MHQMVRENADRLRVIIEASAQFRYHIGNQLSMRPAATDAVPVHDIDMRVEQLRSGYPPWQPRRRTVPKTKRRHPGNKRR